MKKYQNHGGSLLGEGGAVGEAELDGRGMIQFAVQNNSKACE